MTVLPWVNWIAVIGSLLLLVGHEGWALWVGRRSPHKVARLAHAQLRVEWVRAMSARPGFEIVSVQALRNSLMSATISASTAALAVMGAVSLTGTALAAKLGHWSSVAESLHTLLQALMVVMLFASYICSAMAMRYYSHAGFVMSMPVDAPERKPLNRMASEHVRRAGLLYSWGLRLFMMVASIVAGIVHPLAMPPITVMLLIALHYFARPAELEIAREEPNPE